MKTKNYTQKFEELTKIVKELEGGDITIDDMTLKIQQALVLLDECKESLSIVTEDMNKIRDEINSANENNI